MILLNPRHLDRHYPDERSAEVMRRTVSFFEAKGLAKVKEDDRAAVWYRDFLDFARQERLFPTMCTPAGYGAPDCRWDTWRICEFAEILGFYGLPYWYTWQVSVLGLGPIWMSDNEAVKQEAARLLEKGGIFAFGLSEKAHGADLYSTEMTLTPAGDGTWRANGRKYYIGNGNEASLRFHLREDGRHRRVLFLRDRPAAPELRLRAERRAQPELRGRVRAARLPGARRRTSWRAATRPGTRPSTP